jgi:flagellar protein FlaG
MNIFRGGGTRTPSTLQEDAMDGIQNVHGAYLYPQLNSLTQHVTAKQAENVQTTRHAEHVTEQTKKVMHEMQAVSQVFNTRLEYRYNETLKQVVVKVYDSKTDTLIKELPSAEMQAMHTRIREMLGLFLEKNI